jgi:hypothetical protein
MDAVKSLLYISAALSIITYAADGNITLLEMLCLILLRLEGVTWSAQWIPTAVNLGFIDWSRYFSIQVASQLSSRG